MNSQGTRAPYAYAPNGMWMIYKRMQFFMYGRHMEQMRWRNARRVDERTLVGSKIQERIAYWFAVFIPGHMFNFTLFMHFFRDRHVPLYPLKE